MAAQHQVLCMESLLEFRFQHDTPSAWHVARLHENERWGHGWTTLSSRGHLCPAVGRRVMRQSHELTQLTPLEENGADAPISTLSNKKVIERGRQLTAHTCPQT